MPFIYRNHEATAAAPGRDAMLTQVNQALLYPDQLGLLQRRMVLWMQRAEYSTKVLGHYGLNVVAYTHATSPIRRYVDLVNQRMITAALKGEPAPYTETDLQAIAVAANEWRRQNRDARDEAAKARMIQARRRELEGAVSFKGMPPSQFSRLLKRAAKDGTPPEVLAAEVVSRANAGKLGAFDAYAVLFVAGDEWGDIKQAVAAMLEGCPHVAMCTLDILRARDGVAYEIATSGAQGPFRAVVRAQDGERRIRAEGEGPTKKAAAGRAAAAWICGRIGRVADGGPALEEDDGGDAPTDVDARSPVSALQELCHKRVWPTPAYEFDRSGPSHAPTFTCRASVGAIASSATTGATKREAKDAAARQLLGALSDEAHLQGSEARANAQAV